MDRNRTVAGLDVHKDSIYLCIMGHDEAIIFEKTYGVLTPDLRQMCDDMVDRGVTEAAMESTAVYWVPVWNELCDSEISSALRCVVSVNSSNNALSKSDLYVTSSAVLPAATKYATPPCNQSRRKR